MPVIEGVAAAVAKQEGRDPASCRSEMFQRIDLILARCAAHSIQRRNAAWARSRSLGIQRHAARHALHEYEDAG